MTVLTPAPASPATQATHASKIHWLRYARHACLRVPPLWPLHSFVAVNPFTGLTGLPFAEVCGLMRRVTHESMLMSARYFRQQHASGRITGADIAEAIRQASASTTPEEMLAWLDESHPGDDESALYTLADCLDASGSSWGTLITEEISKWCAAYLDDAQSSWRMPWKKLPLFSAWRQAAKVDATPEILGLTGFRKTVSALPDSAAETLPLLLEKLGIPEAHATDYLHRLLMTLPGWSSYVQYHSREKAMHGTHDESLLDLLVVRLVFEAALLEKSGTDALSRLYKALAASEAVSISPGTQQLVLWHAALEVGFQRHLRQQLQLAALKPTPEQPRRPMVQAVFCIDVRSELMRRSLESISPEIETLGFAGFFGMPVEHVPFGVRKGVPQLPIFFQPKYRVREHLPQSTPEDEKELLGKLRLERRLNHSWNAFKTSAVSCFSFVEAAGVGYAWRLLKDGFQLGKRHEPHVCHTCAAPNLHEHKAHAQDLPGESHPQAGIPAEDQVRLAHGALKNMGLTRGFGSFVLLCGHGSSTRNNPYGASLDCGACGGHAGGVNARIAATLLNQPHVRLGLREHHIHIPDDTWFLAAQHDTTTDEFTLYDLDAVPPKHATALDELRLWLDEAGQRTRKLRATTLGISTLDARLDAHVKARARDWSQVRPEWGLAGNAAFIAAPRARTRGLDLQGRVFLHEYDPANDPEKTTLELILTAPMVVASWINLQYYASTVNNRLWGSGTKVTHNVVGAFGIQQGNGGDLRSGLPIQSLHSGGGWMHEPMRLSVFIEATPADVDAVLAAHESVRQLVDNGWLHLHVMEEAGRVIRKREPGASWSFTSA